MNNQAYGSDLSALVDAYSGLEPLDGDQDEAIPNAWTPAHVMARLVDAYDVLRRSAIVVGPANARGFWPTIIHDVADQFDAQTWAQRDKDLAAESERRGARPTSLECSRMDHAIGWAARYLSDSPVFADAIGLWASSKALGFSVEKVIATRRKMAAPIRDRMQEQENASKALAFRQAEANIIGWHRRKVAFVTDRDQIAQWATKAHIRRAEAFAIAIPARISLSQAMPGKVMSRTSLDAYRKQAASIIAEGLNRDGVQVW